MLLHQLKLQLTPQLGHWLDQLYQQAQCQPFDSFKHWCFSSLKQLIPFESGLWATRSDMLNLQHVHWVEDTCLHNLPDDFMANYFTIASKPDNPDPLNHHLTGNPNQFFEIWDACPPEHWYQTDYYLQHCRLFKIEQAISAMTLPTEQSVVSHVISFYRQSPNDPFSANEKLLVNFILPNLVEAFRSNVLNTFSQVDDNPSAVRAVLDRFGEIVDAEEGFLSLMVEKQLLLQTKVNMPQLLEITTSASFVIADITLKINFTDGLFYVTAFESILTDKLTKRQKEICELMVKGVTNQEIANILANTIQPDTPLQKTTVNAHMRNIFGLLRVTSRAAATAYLIRQGFIR